jgi:hypothetical protein
MSKKERPDDLTDFVVGLVCVSGIAIALVCMVYLAVSA